MKLRDNDGWNGIFFAMTISGSRRSNYAVPAATTREQQIIIFS